MMIIIICHSRHICVVPSEKKTFVFEDMKTQRNLKR